jgi:aspartate oxidase
MDKEFYSASWQGRPAGKQTRNGWPLQSVGGQLGLAAGRGGWEAQNLLTVAWLVAELALRRTETRGVHCRVDFPETDPAWARRQTVRRTEQQLVVE